MQPNLNQRVAFEGDLVHIGHFECSPEDPAWSQPNQVWDWPTISFTLLPVRIHQADAESFVADSNTAIFFNVQHPYTRSKIHERGARAFYFEVRPSVLADGIRAYDPAAAEDAGRPFRFTHGPAESRNYLIERLVYQHVLKRGIVDAMRVEETTLSTLADVIRDAYDIRGRSVAPRRSSTTHARRECVEETKQLLATRYAEKLSLQEISKAVDTSPFHLSRIFREHTGSSVHRYLNRLRLRASIERLRDGYRNLARVAAETGFSSHPHFTDAFRREFGASPSHIRESLERGNLPN